MNSTNTRLTRRITPLTPANMRRVGGGYVPIHGRNQTPRTSSVMNSNENAEIARLRAENIAFRYDIESLKAERLHSETAFAQQEQAGNIIAAQNENLMSQLATEQRMKAEQKAYIRSLLLQLQIAISQNNESKKKLEKAQADLTEAMALTNDYRTQLTKISHDRNMVQLTRIKLSPIQPLKSESKRLAKERNDGEATSFIKKMSVALTNENKGLHNKVDELRATIEQLNSKLKRSLKVQPAITQCRK